jgi:lysophospholipase
VSTAPLTILDGAPIPQGIMARWITGVKGCRLRVAVTPVPAAPQGTVILLNGRADFIEKHFEVLSELQQRGYATVAFDWRGQGLSDRLCDNRLKGHAIDFDDHINDLAIIAAEVLRDRPKPLIVLGHSMGGALAVRAVAERVVAPSRVVLTSPLFAINTGGIPEAAGRFLVKTLVNLRLAEGFFPGRATDPLVETIAHSILTHDSVRFKRSQNYMRANPDLMLGGVTIGWLNAAFHLLDAIWAPGVLEGIDCPVAIVAAEHDALVDVAATQKAAQRMPHGQCVAIAQARHEILHETDDIRARFWAMWDQT